MSIQDLGSIAEILAAIATLGTLIYLALQIRQNTKAVRATAARETLFRFGEFHREVARDPELRRIMDKSVQDPMAEYTPEGWNQLHFLIKSFFHIVEAQYIHGKLDIGSEDLVEPHLRAARSTLEAWPAWKKFWEEESRSGHWTEGFVEAIEKGQAGSMTGVKTIREQSGDA